MKIEKEGSMNLKTETVKMIEVSDWDSLVVKTYGRPYDFQQQDGCKDRGTFKITVPCKETNDYKNETVQEEVDCEDGGVSFAAWLKRDPKQPLSVPDTNGQEKLDWCIKMWWERNFYPDIQMVANDLHSKGLLKAGKYVINIDW